MLDRLLKVNNRKLLMGRDKVTDRTDHVVEHGTGHTRIDTDPEGMICLLYTSDAADEL